jgi:hypothetical protein
MNTLLKWILVLIIGCFLGVFGIYTILAGVFIAVLGTVIEYIKVMKGSELNPYQLMEKIKYASVILATSVFVYSTLAERYIIGGLIGIGILLLAATLIHTIRTDVLVLNE